MTGKVTAHALDAVLLRPFESLHLDSDPPSSPRRPMWLLLELYAHSAGVSSLARTRHPGSTEVYARLRAESMAAPQAWKARLALTRSLRCPPSPRTAL